MSFTPCVGTIQTSLPLPTQWKLCCSNKNVASKRGEDYRRAREPTACCGGTGKSHCGLCCLDHELSLAVLATWAPETRVNLGNFILEEGFHALWQWHSACTVQVSGCLLGIPLWGMTIKCHHHSLYLIGSKCFTGSGPSLRNGRATLLCKRKCAGLQKWQTHLIRHGKLWVHLLYFLWALPA